MIKILILSQGPLAQELLGAAQTIVGKELAIGAVSLGWGDSFEEARRKARGAIREHDADDGLLILTDIYGGTPYNVATSFRRPGQIEVVTGVNLPMVVRLGCHGASDMALPQLADWIQKKGQGSICRAGSSSNGADAPATPAADCADDRA